MNSMTHHGLIKPTKQKNHHLLLYVLSTEFYSSLQCWKPLFICYNVFLQKYSICIALACNKQDLQWEYFFYA